MHPLFTPCLSGHLSESKVLYNHSVSNIMVGELMLMEHMDGGKPKYFEKMLVPGILVGHSSHREWTGMTCGCPHWETSECDNSRIGEQVLFHWSLLAYYSFGSNWKKNNGCWTETFACRLQTFWVYQVLIRVKNIVNKNFAEKSLDCLSSTVFPQVFKTVKWTPCNCYLVYYFQICIFTSLLCFTEHTGIIKISSYS